MKLLRGNQIDLLCGSGEYFPALLAAIAAAQNEVRLETYIFAADESGKAVAAELAAAARRGVRVHVVVDGFGSPHFMTKLGASLRAAGVEIFIYRPENSLFRLRRSRLRRLHRKLVYIDGRTAFVGGINIDDDGPPGARSMPRLDYAVRVSGPLLLPIQKSMYQLWSLLRAVNLGRRYAAKPLVVASPTQPGNIAAAFVVRDNLRHRHAIEEAYLKALAGAKENVVIANPYFLPGRRFRHALIATVKRGVNVTLLIQGRVEYRLLHYASLGGYDRLMAAGVHVFEYHKSFLHAKVAVVDGRWATVGSSNIDPFSLLLAREANIVVEDSGFAALLEQRLRDAIAEGATPLAAGHPLALYQRMANWVAYGMARLFIGLTGYGRDF